MTLKVCGGTLAAAWAGETPANKLFSDNRLTWRSSNKLGRQFNCRPKEAFLL
jgi:hypothetical protein